MPTQLADGGRIYHRIALAIYALLILMSIWFALKYLGATEALPYHVGTIGRAWTDIDTGTRSVILAMYRTIGGGFLAVAILTSWLFVHFARGERWAMWAALSGTLGLLLPILYAILAILPYNAGAPLMPCIFAIVMALAGFVATLRMGTPPRKP
jgi:hypothetical protein